MSFDRLDNFTNTYPVPISPQNYDKSQIEDAQ